MSLVPGVPSTWTRMVAAVCRFAPSDPVKPMYPKVSFASTAPCTFKDPRLLLNTNAEPSPLAPYLAKETAVTAVPASWTSAAKTDPSYFVLTLVDVPTKSLPLESIAAR